MSRRLPVAMAIGIGILVLLDRFITNLYLDALGMFFLDTAVILAAFALLVGFVNVFTVHVRKIRARRPGWPYSTILVCFSFSVFVIGWFGPSTPLLQQVFRSVQYPLQATVASLLIFFIASAAFRTLKVRNLESLFLVGVVVIVLLGEIPLSAQVTALKDWILSVPALAGVRGLILGVALGTAVTGLRVLMGIDRPYSK